MSLPWTHWRTSSRAKDESAGLVSQPRRLKASGSTTAINNMERSAAYYEPFVLRKATGLSLVAILVFLSAMIQVIHAVVNFHLHGIGPVTSTTTKGDSASQYLSSAPTIGVIIISALLGAAVGTMDFSLKRIEPYRHLGLGDASADNSLLLEYLGISQIFVWRTALVKRHWIVFLSTLACLLSLVLSPLSSALFNVRSALKTDNVPITLSQTVGQPIEWDDLVPAYSATNIIASLFLSNGSLPAFVDSEWAVAASTINKAARTGLSANSTLNGTLPGILSQANCEDTEIQWSSRNSDSKFNATITGKRSGVTRSLEPLPSWGETGFNASVTNLNGQTDPRFQSFIYRIFTPLTEDFAQRDNFGPPNLSVTICNPTVQAQKVAVGLDFPTRSLLSTRNIAQSPATNLSFLNGNAGFNGYYFDVSAYGPIVAQRKEATMFGLVSVMYQAAVDYPGGLSQAYEDNAHFNLTRTIYQNYLSLFALKNYFKNAAPSDQSRLIMASSTLQNLIFVSTSAAIAISVVLLIIAALAFTALMLHWRTFGKIGLRVDPASMAGTGMTMVGGDVARLLSDPNITRRDMKAAIRKYRWSLVEGKVCATNGLEDIWEDKGIAVRGTPEGSVDHLVRWPET